MKTKYVILLGLIVVFSSCSSAYKSGQTPDDVYYSPAPAISQEAYVVSEKPNSYYDRSEDQEIRRGIQDSRYRSNVTLDLGFGYNPYAYNPYGFNYNPYGFNYSPYNYNPYSYNPYSMNSYGYKGIYDPYGFNNYSYGYNNFGNYNYGYNYYNPYYGSYYPPVYAYPGIGGITNSTPRKVNLGAYNNNTSNNNVRSNGRVINPGFTNRNSSAAPVRTFSEPQTQTRQTGVGNVIRRVFTPSTNERSYNSSSNRREYNNNSRSNTQQAPVRTFDNAPANNARDITPSNSRPSSSDNNSSSGSAPVRTFRK